MKLLVQASDDFSPWHVDTDSDDRADIYHGMQINRDVTLLYLMESEYLETIDVDQQQKDTNETRTTDPD